MLKFSSAGTKAKQRPGRNRSCEFLVRPLPSCSCIGSRGRSVIPAHSNQRTCVAAPSRARRDDSVVV
jgi:hypothetical protein